MEGYFAALAAASASEVTCQPSTRRHSGASVRKRMATRFTTRAVRLLSRMLDALLDRRDRDAPEHEFELVL